MPRYISAVCKNFPNLSLLPLKAFGKFSLTDPFSCQWPFQILFLVQFEIFVQNFFFCQGFQRVVSGMGFVDVLVWVQVVLLLYDSRESMWVEFLFWGEGFRLWVILSSVQQSLLCTVVVRVFQFGFAVKSRELVSSGCHGFWCF